MLRNLAPVGARLFILRRPSTSPCAARSHSTVALYEPLPAIHFIPTVDFKRDPADYQCPLYKTAVRAGVLSPTGQSTNCEVSVEAKAQKEIELQDGVVFGGSLLDIKEIIRR